MNVQLADDRGTAGALGSRDAPDDRRSGALLLEITLAITVLTIGILAFMGSFQANSLALSTVNQLDEAASAVSNVAEELVGVPLSDVYANYHGKTVSVPALEAADGNPARVEILCHVDETALPAPFGPLQDIDGDPTTDTTDASATYELLPVQLRLAYVSVDGLRVQEIYMVLGLD